MANKTIVDLENDLVKPYIDSVKSQLAVGGSINLAPNYLETNVNNGITWTKNSDGTVTANGTASANSTVNFSAQANNWYLPAGTYKITGCPSGGSSTKYYIRVYNVDSSATEIARDYGSGDTFTLAARTRVSMTATILSGQTASNLVFKPMVTVSTYSGAYVPYAATNEDLTARVDALESAPAKYVKYTVSGLMHITINMKKNCQMRFFTNIGDFQGMVSNGSTWILQPFLNNRPDLTTPTVTYAINGSELKLNFAGAGYISGFIVSNDDEITITSSSTSTPEANTLEVIGLPILNSVDDGLLRIPEIVIPANTATEIISAAGIYLVAFTHYEADCGGLYLMSVHSSTSSQIRITPILAPTAATLTFDTSAAGKVSVTSNHNIRATVLRLRKGNY